MSTNYRVDLLDLVKKQDGNPSNDPKDYDISCTISPGVDSIVWLSSSEPDDLSDRMRPHKALVFSKWQGHSLTGSYVPYQVLLYTPSLETDGTTITDSEVSDESVVIRSKVHESSIKDSAYVEESSFLRSTVLDRASVKKSTIELTWIGNDAAVLRSTVAHSTIEQVSDIRDSIVRGSVIGHSTILEGSSVTRCSIYGPVLVNSSNLTSCSIGGDVHIHNSRISSVSLCASGTIIDANICGPEDVVSVGPSPSSGNYTVAYRDRLGLIRISCGCFNGNIEEFEDAIHKTHAKNEFYLSSYLMYADLIKKYFKLAS